MDLLQTVRKEGSRGGRADFKWEDVKADQHRENYLGHSLMAPVGRWQKNKDLNWYARSSGDGQPQSEADARKEEIRRVKEAEADALARALGYDVPVRPVEGNANMTQLGDRESKVIKESVEEEAGQEEGVKGIGFGGFAGARGPDGDDEEIMEGGNSGRGGLDKKNVQRILKDMGKEDRSRKSMRRDDAQRMERRRSRSRDGDRRRHRHQHADGEDHRRRHWERSRSGSRLRDGRRRSRSGDRRPREYAHHREERSERDGRSQSTNMKGPPRRRRRSRSPYQRTRASHRND